MGGHFKRSGTVIGLCDRALGCEARADNLRRTAPSDLRVFTPQNRMRMTRSLCRVWRQVVVCRETTSL